MTHQTDDYFNNGVLSQTLQAERNLKIWFNIAEEADFLRTQSKTLQSTFIFIQQSAQTNFVLALGKLFDNPSKQFDTRCILSFLYHIGELTASQVVEITETTITEEILKEHNCPKELIESITNRDKTLFLRLFSEYYLEKFKSSELQLDIQELKKMRDKSVAHNEVIPIIGLDLQSVTRLLAFCSEIIAIFGIAYHSTMWKTNDFSFIEKEAHRNAEFINILIKELKQK